MSHCGAAVAACPVSANEASAIRLPADRDHAVGRRIEPPRGDQQEHQPGRRHRKALGERSRKRDPPVGGVGNAGERCPGEVTSADAEQERGECQRPKPGTYQQAA